MEHAIRFHQSGGPEVLVYEPIEVAAPGAGEVRLRHTAIGLNFIDIYHRSGLYPQPLPSGLGTEAAGVIEAIGPGVTSLMIGDRVAYCGGSLGAYATARNFPADRLIKLPDGISDDVAASIMLQGLTVWYLLRRTYPVTAGETILWQAAAGGVGLIAMQWAKHLGVRIIGTVGSPEKAAIAKAHGCDDIILYRSENVAERVKALTNGKGVPVVYDSVGKDTWDASLDCLQPRGLMVSFGNASGAVPPINVGLLSAKGSLFLTRPTLFHYIAERAEFEAAATELFDLVLKGVIKPNINQRFPLADAAEAQRALAGRSTTGSTILLP